MQVNLMTDVYIASISTIIYPLILTRYYFNTTLTRRHNQDKSQCCVVLHNWNNGDLPVPHLPNIGFLNRYFLKQNIGYFP